MKQALEYLDQRCKFEHGLQQLNEQFSEAPNDLDRKRLQNCIRETQEVYQQQLQTILDNWT